MKAQNIVEVIGISITTLGLSLVLLWFGIFKFTPTEAEGIVDLVKSNPLMSWLYKVFSIKATSQIIGTVEIIAGLALIVGLFVPKIFLIGSGLATIIFFITCTFMLSTSGMLSKIDGLWVPSDLGGFLIKDIVAFGASLFLFSKSISNL